MNTRPAILLQTVLLALIGGYFCLAGKIAFEQPDTRTYGVDSRWVEALIAEGQPITLGLRSGDTITTVVHRKDASGFFTDSDRRVHFHQIATVDRRVPLVEKLEIGLIAPWMRFGWMLSEVGAPLPES